MRISFQLFVTFGETAERLLGGWSDSGSLDGDVGTAWVLLYLGSSYDIKAPYLCCLRLEKYYEWKRDL